jgi:hypothetical protein
MRITTVGIFFIIVSTVLKPQSTETWYPSDLNIRPFTANVLEPRAGVSYLKDLDKLQLNIGTTSDIYEQKSGNSTLSFGADLFTYTRLQSNNNFRFPVETIDYFFGINSGYKIINGSKQYGFRLRLSHISTHLADGSFDKSLPTGQAGSGQWENGIEPFVYSREFLELFPFYQTGGFRGYVGLTYLFHVIPDVFGRGIYQAGFDYYLTSLISRTASPFIAYDFKLLQINKYSGNNVLAAGIKFGRYDKKGFSILYSYFCGKSVQGQFYNLNERYSSIGINLDL